LKTRDTKCLGRRGSNSFKRNDLIRAVRSARDAGVEVSGVDVVVAPDGTTTFRVLGPQAAASAGSEIKGASEWDAEIEKLRKAKKER
jgi:hypothetical protein